MDSRLQNGTFIYKQAKKEGRAGLSLTNGDFQITNEMRQMEMEFLDYKRDSGFAIHLVVI